MADLLDERTYVLEGPTGHLLISQDDLPDGLPSTEAFAVSAPGGVILAAEGESGVHVTLQRWTARPPVEASHGLHVTSSLGRKSSARDR